jgi:Mce-associated membrane protein
MTPQPGKAAGKPAAPEKESDAVRVDTETTAGQDDTTVIEDATENPEIDTAERQSEETSGGVTDSSGGPADDSEDDGKDVENESSAKSKRSIDFPRVIAFGLLPGLALSLAAAAAFLKWQDSSIRASRVSGVESVAAAKDGTIAMLSYQPDTVEKDLGAARNRLTGTFKESYTQLTNDVVIPGAKQRHISAVATVPAVASVSASGGHAIALVFVNQTVVVGRDAPSATASSVRVTLDRVGDRWLISGFDPV